jgi:general stress protein 26
MGKKLQKLFEMIEEIETAMMTTRREDGHLVSRAMATQKRVPGADLWFVTDERSAKLKEIEFDPHVNLAYYKDRTREWVSVSGIATISRDRRKIRQLYAEDWRAWFADEGDPRHGTPEDPRIVLVGVKIHTGFFLEINKPQPVVLYELVKGMILKEAPKLGAVKGVDGKGRSRSVPSEKRDARSRSARESVGSGASKASSGTRGSRGAAKGSSSARTGGRGAAKPAAAGARKRGASTKRSS